MVSGVAQSVGVGGMVFANSLIEIDATVGELAERSLSLQLCSFIMWSADIPSSSAPLWPFRHHRVFNQAEFAYRLPLRRSINRQ